MLVPYGRLQRFVHCDPHAANVLIPPGFMCFVHAANALIPPGFLCFVGVWVVWLGSQGFVHCDPHAANVLIRPMLDARGRPTGQPQLVLLDHGLYKELDEPFRLCYSALWRALVLADVPTINKCCATLNAGDLAPLLAAMLVNKPWDQINNPELDSLRADGDDAEKAMLQGYAKRYFKEISLVLNRVPRQMLLLFKCNDCLRHIDRKLGAPVNTFLITAKTCARALWAHETEQGAWRTLVQAPGRFWAAARDWLGVHARILTYQALVWLGGLLRLRSAA